ncbi:unnamed protein product [Rotaria sordida]|uniref:C2 domain-containing protein n=1 Tax=Rotaria sordida TaxID=392033 RepID=A0A815Q300_9BILA|nr:unnamed protein product [Rotaria sordida]
MSRMSINRALSNSEKKALLRSITGSNMSLDHLMLQLDFNKNPITLRCRLYIIKALLYRGWDQAGKADPFIKIALNNDTVIDDADEKLRNTLEPVFGKSYEFDVQLPFQSLIRIQIWDWDMTSPNDMIGETKIDVENRWFSCHRATCGLPKRYDSAGYNTWRDTKKPAVILVKLCRTTNINAPVYTLNFCSVTVGNESFECDPACVEFIRNAKSSVDTLHRKAHHELPEEYIRQNTALAALHGWGRKINMKHALVAEHIECRSLFNPEFPGIEQGKLEMWLDFFPMSRPPSSAMIDITPPKPTSYQLRITIWNTSEVELNDENFLTSERTSDIYVKAWIIGERIDGQQTDIHYRSLTGEGNFNWRFVFDFDYLDIEEKIVFEAKDSVFQVGNTTKKIPPRIIIRVYDADLFSADDFLGECNLNLTHVPLGAKTLKKCTANILLDPKYKGTDLFVNKRLAGWWPMIAPLKVGEIRDKTLLGGKLEAEFSLITAEEAEKNPVGKAREAPQPLEEPNRPKTSFLWFTSPWRTLRFVIWRNFKWTIILGVLIFIGVIFLLLVVWSIPGEIIRQGKFRVQETPEDETDNMYPTSTNRAISNSEKKALLKSKTDSNMPIDHLMLQLGYSKNLITLKCRLYIIKALLYRGWDQAGKADPFIKIVLNEDTVIDDIDGKLLNTLEPVFGKSYEFDVQLPFQSLIRIQIWDWDMTSPNDMIAETKIDIENRRFSCHRATCGLPKRYDSAGYNTWRDTKKPSVILTELCRATNINEPDYTLDFCSVKVGNESFQCDPDCVEFLRSARSSVVTGHRKVHHELPEEYIRQNTALAALHGWGRKINTKHALVAEHIESRSLFNPKFPEIEQGKLEMWLDFFPMSRPPSSAMIDITPPKPTAYQLRVTIWNTSEVELNDSNLFTGERTSDIYVKAWVVGERIDAQQTDIHYRSLTGEGNFNWRFVFDFDYLDIEEKIVFEAKDSLFQVGNTTKKIPPRIIIRVYDADLFSADDFLGECMLNLIHVPLGAKTLKKCTAGILLDPKHKGTDLFLNKRLAGWWPMIAPLKLGEIRDKALVGGKLEAEFSLVTAEEAEKNPVGKAREAPQPLAEPNRPKTSFLWFTAPWKTLRFVLWRNFKWTIITGIFIFIGVIFVLLAVWSIPGELIRQLGTKIFNNK